MSFKSRIRIASVSALPLCLWLSACGGAGSSNVANIPPPPATPTPMPTPTPTPTPSPTPKPTGIEVQTTLLDSPVTRSGEYGIIGRLSLTPGNGDPSSYRLVAPGEFTIGSIPIPGAAYFRHRINAPAGILPGTITSIDLGPSEFTWTFNPGGPNFRDPEGGDYIQAFGQNLKEYEVYPDGTKTLRENNDFSRESFAYRLALNPNQNLQTSFTYDVGYSYVAMGEWSWRPVDLAGNSVGGSGDLFFVNGDRTPASGIPTSGTATYDARTLSLLSGSGTPGLPFSLTADFGQRTIAALINQDYRYDPTRSLSDDPILGIHVAGSAPFSNDGLFGIPLTGTANYTYYNQAITPVSEAVTGTMNGAFFGPSAQQVGGVFSLERTGGVLLIQDAFVGKQRP